MTVNVAGKTGTERVDGELVSGDYFAVLGVGPAVGRVFSRADETAPGADAVAVLSYDCWRRRFGGDPEVVGRTLTVNGTPLTVVGVARAGFDGVQVGQTPDLFIPITMKATMTPNWNGLDDHRDYWLAILGRLRPGLNVAAAEDELKRVFRPLLEAELPLMNFPPETQERFLSRYHPPRSGRARPRHPPGGDPAGAGGAGGDGRGGAADRLRQPGEPASGARRSPPAASWPSASRWAPAAGGWSASSSPRACCSPWPAPRSAC